MGKNNVFISTRSSAPAYRRVRSRVLPAYVLPAILSLGSILLSACGGGSGATTVTSVAITATATTTPINGQITFTATVNLNNSSTTSTTTTVSWEVNAVAGGNATCGSIVPFTTDQLEATYTAPASVPTSSCGATAQLGEVAVTAVASQTTTGSTATVTSNTVLVTIGNGLGLTVTPTSANVAAGGTQQYTALLNGVQTAASWTLSTSSAAGGNLGTVDGTGLYTAPPFPPPGASVTITETVDESDGSIVTATDRKSVV